MSGVLAIMLGAPGSSGGGGGGGGSGGYSIAPVSQSFSGTSPTQTFAGEVISGPLPTSYIWSIINTSGGMWSIFSGAGTNTAVARVTNVTAGDFVSAELQCAILVGGVTYYVSAPLEYTRT